MSTVGIVMATYNGMKYISEQIESILSNSYTDWKLWICDDGSKDDTISIIKRYEEKYPDKIKVHLNAKNRGVILNFLEGAKRCDTDYIMFCDQDDVWSVDKIQVTLDEMKKNELKVSNNCPIIIFTDATVVDRKLHTIHPSFHKASRLDTKKLDLPHLLMENKLIGCTIMMNHVVKEMLTKMPKSARVHDWWIALLTASFGKIIYLDKPTLLYRQHENNVIGNQNFISYVKDRIGSIKKQKQILLDTQEQAYNFYAIYGDTLSNENKQIVYEFAFLHKRNWLLRRFLILKRGYLKTGIIRNIGVLLLI